MQETSTDSKPEEIRRDSTKIYFFVVAIVALLATNVYFYMKYNNAGERVYELTSEKVNMQAEIDRIEAELDRLTEENTELSASLEASRDSVRAGIAELRKQLAHNNLTREELLNAQHEINQLKTQVANYSIELDNLKSQNAELISERDELRQEISSSTDRLTELEEENLDLVDKVRVASALKVSNISINGIRERSRERENVEVRVRRVDKLKIDFTIADNPLATAGLHNIYMRVIDPSGNLRTVDNGIFELDGKQIQYTYKTSIDFTNDGSSYSIEWKDPKGFQKGTYTVLLYTDDSVMGQSSVVLK